MPQVLVRQKPLEKYQIENLGQRTYKSEMVLDEPIATESAYTVFGFHFDSDGKKVTGITHIPNLCNKCPVIVQFRGYVDREIYQPGVGTQRSAQVFARNGFITVAPDFLGYGGSDMPTGTIFEERFLTYMTALNLLAAVEVWEKSNGQVGIWGHSNGGQIALTILEATEKEYPTTLWAPVSKSFPYSILYYTEELPDEGKYLRKELAKFEEDYDVFRYDITKCWDRIKAPVQIHQGTGDEAVDYRWSRELAEKISGAKYFEYPEADHNLMPAWNTVVARDVAFFHEKLKLAD